MSYLTTVIADAPDHYWRAADPGGIFLHDIGSAPHTMLLPIDGSVPYTGPNSDGGSFGPTGNGGARAQETILLPSPRTLECWYYPIIVPKSVFLISFDGVAFNQWGLSTDANGHIAMAVNNTNIISAVIPTSEHWHHIVGTYDGTNGRLYLDAILVGGPTAIAAPANTARNFEVGANTNHTAIAYGAFAEVATYPVALSAARVTAHFLAVDNVPSTPVFRGPAFFSSGSDSSGDLITSINDILNSVRKVY